LIKKKTGITKPGPAADEFISGLRSAFEAIAKNAMLYGEKSFDQRTDAIDYLGFHIIGQIESLLQKAGEGNELILLKHRAEKVKAALEEVDARLFEKLRAKIRTGNCRGRKFRKLVGEYFSLDPARNPQHYKPGFDNLDLFINGLLSVRLVPEQTKALEPEMVFYQKTPARILFELADKCDFAEDDVFFDLGSGLGQAAILINLLTGAKVKGIEFEPAFCDYSRDCAASLNLSGITFINTDARQADYSDGTVLFMYTPFNGAMMNEVLARLKMVSLQRKIRIITYGPCTPQVAAQSWLHPVTPSGDKIYQPAIFSSF